MPANTHKPDGLLRIPVTALPMIKLRHLISDIDMSIEVVSGIEGAVHRDVITGFTEWVGSWQDAEISLGWDWAVGADGIVPINHDEIRTNVHLLAENGTPMPTVRSRARILQWIESQSWRTEAIEKLIAQRSGKPPRSS